MIAPRRIAVVASCSGQGKTTFARRLAMRLGTEHVELDGLMHQAGWTALPDDEFVSRVEAALARDGWVIDGAYFGQLGRRVIDAADLVVFFDLPTRVWLPRLLRRTLARIIGRQVLWNGNRETWRGAFWGRDSLFGYALRHAGPNRRAWAERLVGVPHRRVTSDADLGELLQELGV